MTMKKLVVSFIALALLMTSGFAGTAMAAKKKAKTMKFVIVTTHTDAECMKAMGEIGKDKRVNLDRTYFGCKSGDHTVWTIVDAKNADDAKSMLPESMQATAKIVGVDKFTAKQLKSMHSEKM